MWQKISLILILVSIILTFHEINGLPNIFCDPFFGTMTKLVNDSYFMIDDKGNYWTVEENGKIMKSSPMGKVSDLITISNQSLNHLNVDLFDLTYMINFDKSCNVVKESIFGLKFFASKFLYTIFKDNQWTDSKPMRYPNEMGHHFLTNVTLSTSNRISAILNFKTKSMLILQGIKLFHVYCDTTDGWKIDSNDNPIQFDPYYQINYGEIFGGLVDNEKQIAYLFQGVRSATKEYIRKWFHECYFTLEAKPKAVPKITFNCTKQSYKWLCVSPPFLEEYRIMLLIIVLSLFALIITLIGICIYCMRREKGGDLLEPKTLNADINSVQVNAPDSQSMKQSEVNKPVLARERTFGNVKPTLKRLRTVEFNTESPKKSSTFDNFNS